MRPNSQTVAKRRQAEPGAWVPASRTGDAAANRELSEVRTESRWTSRPSSRAMGVPSRTDLAALCLVDPAAPRARSRDTGRERLRRTRRPRVSAPGDRSEQVHRLRVVHQRMSRDARPPGARPRAPQGDAREPDGLHRPRRVQGRVPVDAISLVFGTASRGVDIPNVKPNFESNVPGHLHRGRARRHGTDPQRDRAGSPSDGVDREEARQARAAASTSRSSAPGLRESRRRSPRRSAASAI